MFQKKKPCLARPLPTTARSFHRQTCIKGKRNFDLVGWESDQGNCCCPSCNERSGSHRLVARGRSRSTSSTCFYLLLLLLLVMFSFTSTCNRLACLSWLTCSTSSPLMIPIVSFLQHLFPGHWLFLLLCDALQLVCATGSARWLCTLVAGNKLRNKWLGPDSLHGIALC